jgi:deazaflavin-dependent oxidoreductase (nitroreductase family)
MPLRPRPPQLDSPAVLPILRFLSILNVWLYRLTFGFLGGKWRVGAAFPWGVAICLVTTTGRKSGRLRTAPLIYLRDGQNVILVASQGGLPQHPLWYGNLQANPDVTIQIRWSKQKMRARTATAEERARLWPKLVALYADYDQYQAWTTREIPVVICEPVQPS